MSWEPLCAGNMHKRKVAGQTAALEATGVALHSTPLTLHGFCLPRQGTQGHWLSVPALRGAEVCFWFTSTHHEQISTLSFLPQLAMRDSLPEEGSSVFEGEALL